MSPFREAESLSEIHVPAAAHNAHRQPVVRSSSQPVLASLFGVGAPEALVIGVVALIVFGPKGLAEVSERKGRRREGGREGGRAAGGRRRYEANTK